METVYTISFYMIAAMIIIFAILSILCKKTIYSIVTALISLLMTGLLLISLGFSFLGSVQIILSSVSAVILLLFNTIFTTGVTERKYSQKNFLNIFLTVTGTVILLLSVAVSLRAGFFDGVFNNILLPFTVSNKHFAENLFLNYGAVFMFSSLVFLSAVLGIGVMLSEKGIRGEDK